jgi:8-oxo-dGTP pyrophosphatase MutT (NUDIX family)
MPSILFEQSAGIIPFIIRDNEPHFLIVFQYTGTWSFPKGHIEAGETALDTARRELHEETGICHARLVPDFSGTISYQHTKNGQLFDKTVTFFLGEIDHHEIPHNHEIIDHRYVSAPELLCGDFFPKNRCSQLYGLIDQALAYIRSRKEGEKSL